MTKIDLRIKREVLTQRLTGLNFQRAELKRLNDNPARLVYIENLIKHVESKLDELNTVSSV